MEINVARISGLMKFKKMVHGTSPKFFVDDRKKKCELNLNPKSKNWICDSLWKSFLISASMSGRKPFFLNQVHGNQIYCLNEINLSLEEGKLKGDAIISNIPNVNIAVFTADCLPIILYDPHMNVIGVVHAGRIGSSLRILSKTIKKMIQKYSSSPENIVLGIGPGIRGCCYEISNECLEPFRRSYPQVNQLAVPSQNEKYMLDLKSANRLDALNIGILSKNIFDCNICTVCNNDLFFSHRKMDVGRMMTAVMLLP